MPYIKAEYRERLYFAAKEMASKIKELSAAENINIDGLLN